MEANASDRVLRMRVLNCWRLSSAISRMSKLCVKPPVSALSRRSPRKTIRGKVDVVRPQIQ